MSHTLAIAIVTLDRHRELSGALDALVKIDLKRVSEILLVDQTDSPFDVDHWRRLYPVPVHLIHLKEKGLGPARNAALRGTDAEIVLFIDDDVIPDFELVNEHLRVYSEHAGTIGVAGYEDLPVNRRPTVLRRGVRVLLTRALRPYFRRSGYYSPFLDKDGYPAGIITRTGMFLCDFARPNPCRVMTPRGCNMSFVREALLAIGGFDDRFIGPRRDESDASLRLLRAFPDREIWFNPRARLMHLMSPTGGCRDASKREAQRQLLQCEIDFARRHLTPGRYFLFWLRLAAIHGVALGRYPSLAGTLLGGIFQR
jgi:GT2 family glycosyltransferase